MLLVEIGTAGVISAYFFRHITSAYSLNVSDPIEVQPVQLSYYLSIFGCGLVFWLLVLLWAKLHEVAKLAKLITWITTLNLCGCLLVPFMKLPLLVRFLVLFQVSSNLALLLIWTFLSRMIVPDAHTQQQQNSSPEPQKSSPKPRAGHCDCVDKSSPEPQKSSPKPQAVRGVCAKCFAGSVKCFAGIPPFVNSPTLQSNCFRGAEEGSVARYHNVDGVGGKVDEAGGSGSGHGSGASGREENRGRYGGNDGGGGAGGGGDRGESGSGHDSGASGSGENSGGYGGHGRDEGGTGSGHGSGAGGSGENRGRDGGGGDPECGGGGTNTEQAFKISKITEMSLMLTAQTTAALIGFHLTTPSSSSSSSSKALLVVVLIDQLVAYLCGLTSIMLSSNKHKDSKAAKIFADVGFVCTALGFILMVAMFVPWYLVLIALLLFGVVWLIFFRNGLKTRATEVWNYLKNSTQSIKNCIGMLFESGSRKFF